MIALVFSVGAARRKVNIPPDGAVTLEGTVRVTLKAGAAKTNLLEKKLDETYQPMMGGHMGAGLRAVELSPSGKALFIRAYTFCKSGRGGNTSQVPVGYYTWNGDKLE